MKNLQLLELITTVKTCTKCSLWKTRIHAVPGEGSPLAQIMFIGEAPGKNEDLKGRPFVGRAGILLDELLHSINLKRTETYITNILKCRPPKNRNPLRFEIHTCTVYLENQLRALRPPVIVPLGTFATSYIFKKFNLPVTSIGQIHGKAFTIQYLKTTTTIIPFYHPAAAIYNPNLKPKLFNDFKTITSYLPKKT
jgi:DNA polymerase